VRELGLPKKSLVG